MKFTRQVWSQVRQPNVIVARGHFQSLVFWPVVTSRNSHSPLFPFCHPYWYIKIKTKMIFDKNKVTVKQTLPLKVF